MWSNPNTKTIWNALGLTSTNGTVIMSMELFERALEMARLQRPTPDALKGDAKP